MDEKPKDSEGKKSGLWKMIRLYNTKWVILITVWTFILATGLSFISEVILRNVTLMIAFIILVLIIFIGIFFDLIGIAVASARENPFHSMAAHKIKGAKHAIMLVRNAGPVANFCNDVIGDICGIISGAAATIIVLQIASLQGVNFPLLGIALSGVVAALTVGGKAIAKEIALRKSKEIVYSVGKLMYFISIRTGIDFLSNKMSKRRR